MCQEIERNFSYDGYQIVLREMFTHLRELAVTIRKGGIIFNTACIEGLEDTVSIHIMASDDEKRTVINKCDENDVDSIRWCIEKLDKIRGRRITGTFSSKIYELMKWVDGCRYKILGHRINYNWTILYDCEIFKENKGRKRNHSSIYDC